MIHLPGHPYAILKNKLIIDVLATDHNEEVLPMLVEALGGDQAVNCCEYGYDAVVGGDVYLGRLRYPKPFESWKFNEGRWSWEAPIPYPSDNQLYTWDEETLKWLLLPGEFAPKPIIPVEE
jgi:hypothetical protein